MIVTIHQPEHLIWLGLVDKMSQADIIVILDNVQFRKNYYQNRNKIRTNTKDGWTWLTVPLKKQPLATKIKDIEISDIPWKEHYLTLLEMHYAKAPYFKTYYPEIKKIINRNHSKLCDLNMELLAFILHCFKLEDKKIIKASTMDLREASSGSDLILEICKTANADTYLSGSSGPDYLNFEDFEKANVKINVHRFEHPTYSQQFTPFIPTLSSIDALFNIGAEKARSFIKNPNPSI